MDLPTVTTFRRPATRADLALAAGESVVAGGTWVWSTPQPHLTGVVDLTALGWEPWRLGDDGLEVAATCTVADLVAAADGPLAAHPGAALVRRCAESLLMSSKVWQTATVGGNVCLGLPAGAMIALMVGLDAGALVWSPDGSERLLPVAELVTGVQQTALAPGEVLRSFHVPRGSLSASVAAQQISLAAVGRSAALVVGRRAAAATTIVVTASTTRPVVLGLGPGTPDPSALRAALADVDCWYADPHGPADWKAHVTGVLAERVLGELTGAGGAS